MSTETSAIQIPGFGKYEVRDGIITEIETGKVINPNKKGLVAIMNDEGEMKAVNASDLVKELTGGTSESASEASSEAPAVAAKSEEQERLDGLKAKLKALRDNLKVATATLMKAKKDELEAAKDGFDAAEKAIQDFKEAHPELTASSSSKGTGTKKAPKEKAPAVPPTAEQLEAQRVFDEILAEKKVIDEKFAAAVAELKKFKSVKGTGDPASHARKMDYRTVQIIRQRLAAGAKAVDIMEEYGISASAVNYYRNYLQHKLRRVPAGADMTDPENQLLYTAHLPLVNDFYPANWKSKDGVVRHGAPYLEDGVKETDERYNKYPAIDVASSNG